MQMFTLKFSIGILKDFFIRSACRLSFLRLPRPPVLPVFIAEFSDKVSRMLPQKIKNDFIGKIPPIFFDRSSFS